MQNVSPCCWILHVVQYSSRATQASREKLSGAGAKISTRTLANS